jgi:putative transposase
VLTWARQAETDSGARSGITTEGDGELRRLRRKVSRLKFRKCGKSARQTEDERLSARIAAIYAANYSCYGVSKVRRALLNEGERVARCTAERLMKMKRFGLRGAVRGKVKRTTIAGKNANLAEDLVKRKIDAPKPDRLRAADFTYVPTRTGWCYTAFVIDVFARSIGA